MKKDCRGPYTQSVGDSIPSASNTSAHQLGILFVPGYGNSLGEHWQAQWFKEWPDSLWLQQDDWDKPNASTWIARLDETINHGPHPLLIIAHSLGCLTFCHWAMENPELCHQKVRGAFLVAPPDPEATNFPALINGYSPLQLAPLPVPGMLVASTDDPYASQNRSAVMAQAWQCRLQWIGARGHINAQAGCGPWPEGRTLLAEFAAALA